MMYYYEPLIFFFIVVIIISIWAYFVSRGKYHKLERKIVSIDESIQAGDKIKGLSKKQWEICRDEIKNLLKRDLTEKQQRAIQELLSKISDNIYSPDSEEQNMDTDVTIEALNQLFNISSH